MRKADFYVDHTLRGEAVLADRYFLRLRGLIGRDVYALGGLLLEPCNQIHTCFMSTPIDTVYLNREGIVLRVDSAVVPGRFCKLQRGAAKVLELPPDTAAAIGIREGCQLSFTVKS